MNKNHHFLTLFEKHYYKIFDLYSFVPLNDQLTKLSSQNNKTWKSATAVVLQTTKCYLITKIQSPDENWNDIFLGVYEIPVTQNVKIIKFKFSFFSCEYETFLYYIKVYSTFITRLMLLLLLTLLNDNDIPQPQGSCNDD